MKNSLWSLYLRATVYPRHFYPRYGKYIVANIKEMLWCWKNGKPYNPSHPCPLCGAPCFDPPEQFYCAYCALDLRKPDEVKEKNLEMLCYDYVSLIMNSKNCLEREFNTLKAQIHFACIYYKHRKIGAYRILRSHLGFTEYVLKPIFLPREVWFAILRSLKQIE